MARDNRAVNLTPGLNTPAVGRTHPEATAADQPGQESSRPAMKAEDTKGSKLIVGPDIKLKGVEITDCDTLVVEGRVEAAMDSRVIQIAERGVFAGTVGIDVAEIHGRFEGELTARKQLVIHSTGRVAGKIRYGKITVEQGGELSGDIGTITTGHAAEPVPAKSIVTESASPDVMNAYDPFARKGKPVPGKASSLLNP